MAATGPLPSQKIEFPLELGLQQKIDPDVLDPGQGFVTSTNLIHTKVGSLQKAFGYTALGTTANTSTYSITTGRKLFGFNDEICAIGTATSGTPSTAANIALTNALWSYNPTPQEWSFKGNAPDAVVIARAVVGSGTVMDMCSVNGYTAVAMAPNTGNPGTVVILVDQQNGSVVFSGSPTTTGTTNVRLAATAKVLWCLSLEGSGSSGNIVATPLDTTNATTISVTQWGSPVTIKANDCFNFDCASGSTKIFIGLVTDVSGIVEIASLDSSGTVVGPHATDLDSPANGNGIAIGWNSVGDTVWIAACIGQAVELDGYDPAGNLTSPLLTKTTVITADGSEVLNSCAIVRNTTTANGTAMLVAGNDQTGVQTMYVNQFHTSAGSIVAGTTFKHFRMIPVSKPFPIGAKTFVMVSYQSSTTPSAQQSIYCYDISYLGAAAGAPAITRAVCSISPRLSTPPGGVLPTLNPPQTPILIGTTQAVIANTIVESNVVQGVEAVTLDFNNFQTWNTANYLSIASVAGGVPSFYDGQEIVEQGFLVAPEVLALTGVNTGTTFPASSSWDYVAIYEHVDARGQLHRSAPSNPVGITTGGSTHYTSINVKVTNLMLTQRGAIATPNPSDVKIAVYRTVSGGSTYYRVGTISSSIVTSTSTFSDAVADSALQTNSLLYTQPGTAGTALPRVNPPSFNWCISHNGLLVGMTITDVWYTGQPVEGEGPWWSDEFQFPVLGGDGPLTGMASMDGRLVLFKRNAVFVVDGTGAADNGSGNDFSPPNRLPVDVGCLDPRSVVVCSEGIWFQSERGLELLDRSLQLESFAGQPIESIVGIGGQIPSATANNVVAATLARTESRIYFLTRAADSLGASTTVAMRDLVHKTWHQYTSITAVRDAAMVQSSPSLNSIFAVLDDSGVVRIQRIGSCLNSAGAFVQGQLTTAPIKVGGIAGWQRTRRLFITGRSLTSHTLTVSIVNFDGTASSSETHTWTDADLIAISGTLSSDWTVSVQIGRQKSRSMQVQIRDGSPSGGGSLSSGYGMLLLSIGLEYAVYPGMIRIASRARK